MKLLFKTFCLCAAGGAGLPGAAQTPKHAKQHPHIILIMTDQQRADALGCAGNDCVLTPNIDRLAAEVSAMPTRLRPAVRRRAQGC